MILPRAAAKGVLFLESGYFGISKAKNNSSDLGMNHFCTTLHTLIEKFGDKKVVFIGESVGAIHALNYASHYPEKIALVVLSNPAFYKPRWLFDLFFVPILSLSRKISLDTPLRIFGKVLKTLPKNEFKKLGDIYIDISKTIGAKSYFFCLKEIVDFANKYEGNEIKKVFDKTIILKGENDRVFDLLCNSEYCRNSLRYIEVPSVGHEMIDKHFEVVRNILLTC